MKKRNIAIIASIVVVSIALGTTLGHFFVRYNNIYKTCISEAGVEVAVTDFFKKGGEAAVFAADSEPFSIDRPGEYAIRISDGRFTFSSTLIIEDTMPPLGSVHPLVKKIFGSPVSPQDFVMEIQDATAVELSFMGGADFSAPGLHAVQINLKDLGGNETVVSSELLLSAAVSELTIEAGEELPAVEDFIVFAQEAGFGRSLDYIDVTKLDNYPITLNLDGESVESVLHIKDTTPPRLVLRDIEGFCMTPYEPFDFVSSYEDVSSVEFEFASPIDTARAGAREVTVIARDAAGNETRESALLTLIVDDEPPVIKGAADLFTQVGDTISYMKNVTITDNNPDGLEYSVNKSAVKHSVAGSYPVTYTACDAAGNVTSITVTVTVRPKEYNWDAINARADEILAQILTDGMSDTEKLWAIRRYNVNNIRYESPSVKESIARAAYEGLFERKGDCYVFFATAKVLMDRAGIKNSDIERIPNPRNHYWHLVDVGDGWYHYDTCPRATKVVVFMWTDEELREYSDAHGDDYRYDKDLYPLDGREIN